MTCVADRQRERQDPVDRPRATARKKAWREQNPDEAKVLARRQSSHYRQVHGDRNRARSRTGYHYRAKLLELFPACMACKATSNLTVDHVIPLGEPGSDTVKNLQVLCQACNSSKGEKIVDYRTDEQRAVIAGL